MVNVLKVLFGKQPLGGWKGDDTAYAKRLSALDNLMRLHASKSFAQFVSTLYGFSTADEFIRARGSNRLTSLEDIEEGDSIVTVVKFENEWAYRGTVAVSNGDAGTLILKPRESHVFKREAGLANKLTIESGSGEVTIDQRSLERDDGVFYFKFGP